MAKTGPIARITPPCLPGRFCDCLERIQIKAVKQYYIFNDGVSNMGSPYEENTHEEIHASLLGIMLGINFRSKKMGYGLHRNPWFILAPPG